MILNKRLVVLLVVLSALGCKGSTATATDESTTTAAGDGASASVATAGTRVENIVDTTLENKVAYSVTIPAKWKFQGILLQGGVATCESVASTSYRATSEDGQSFDEAMPQLLWAYGDGPKPKTGCLPLSKPISAQEFLKYLSTTMNVAYDGDAPLPASFAGGLKQLQASAEQTAPFYAAHNLPAPHNTVDGAAAMVHYKQNGVLMKGRLLTLLQCTETPHPGFHSTLPGMASTPSTTSGKCTASINYVSAPENQLASVVRLWDDPAMGPHQNMEWGQAWTKRYAEQGKAVNDAMINTVDQRFAAQRQAIQHTMAVQQAVHNQFLQTMQEGTDRSMARAAEVANSNHRAAQDMVDYSLDRQTILDTATGTYYKVTNQLTPGGTVIKTHADGSPW
jgi:hypothetical protein